LLRIAAIPRDPGLVGFLAVPAAGAPEIAARTPGSIYLQLMSGAGVARVNIRGNFLGRIERGKIVATKNVILGHCDARRSVSTSLVECRGHDLTFRTPSDRRWRLRLSGHGINASGFVHGCLLLNGVDSGYQGTFKRGVSGTSRLWPRTATRYGLGAVC
jgi:hypothetical protein